MSQRLSTAGMLLAYCIETTAGTKPTSGYTVVPEVKSMPSFNNAPNSTDVTPLSETDSMQYVAGLRDSGGMLEFGANLTEDLITAWNSTLIDAYETAAASSKACWFAVIHPKLTKAVFFKGEPVALGLNEASVGAAAETTLYIAPQSSPAFDTKPTLADAT